MKAISLSVDHPVGCKARRSYSIVILIVANLKSVVSRYGQRENLVTALCAVSAIVSFFGMCLDSTLLRCTGAVLFLLFITPMLANWSAQKGGEL